MYKIVKRIALLLAIFIVVVFAVFVFNQTVQIVQSARSVNAVFGDGAMWALIFTYCVLLIAPPRALVSTAETHASASGGRRCRV